METPIVVSLIRREEYESAMKFASSLSFLSDAQLHWANEHVTGFAFDKPVDEYEVLGVRDQSGFRALLILRRRPLTRSTYEIGRVLVDPRNSLEMNTDIMRKVIKYLEGLGGTLLFIELSDSTRDSDIQSILLDTEFSIAGRIPHLYEPNIGAIYLTRNI